MQLLEKSQVWFRLNRTATAHSWGFLRRTLRWTHELSIKKRVAYCYTGRRSLLVCSCHNVSENRNEHRCQGSILLSQVHDENKNPKEP